MGRRRWVAEVALAATALVVVSCGGANDMASSSKFDSVGNSISSAGGGEADLALRPSGADGELDATSDALAAPVAERRVGAGVLEPGRKIVFTGDLRVEVDDVAASSQRAIAQVEAAGGWLSSQETSFDREASSTLTFRIPPGDYDRTVARLGELGKVRNLSKSSNDVTERVVDLEARITTAEASVARLRGFMERAGSVAEIASVENELLRRETDLETLQGSLRTLDQQVDMGTLVLTLQSAPHDKPKPAAAVDDELPGFADGLRGGWEAFVSVGTVLLAATGAALPFLPFALVGLAIRRWGRRTSSAGAIS